ncbi:hypothetical protein KSAC_28250 [Komagataeibacter saccharivorans]|nr:hypothetical protein KSAC_21830 [Komagataeibacter saccharivorans]QBL95005.1 hypothetical protein KSAC_28250 [Komagataeibacter saccharivorans]
MIDPQRPRLPIVRQCTLLRLNRSGVYYQPAPENAFNLMLMRLIDEQFMETPYYGARQMARHLRRLGHEVGRKRIGRLMARMGLLRSTRNPGRRCPTRSIAHILISCGT